MRPHALELINEILEHSHDVRGCTTGNVICKSFNCKCNDDVTAGVCPGTACDDDGGGAVLSSVLGSRGDTS